MSSAFQQAQERIAAGKTDMDGSIPATLIYWAGARATAVALESMGIEPDMEQLIEPSMSRVDVPLSKLATDCLSGWKPAADGRHEKSFATPQQRSMAMTTINLLAQFEGRSPHSEAMERREEDGPVIGGEATTRYLLSADSRLIEPLIAREQVYFDGIGRA